MCVCQELSMSAARNAKADKALQDKLQALLSYLLREEDNKYCADCDAKGTTKIECYFELYINISHRNNYAIWIIHQCCLCSNTMDFMNILRYCCYLLRGSKTGPLLL